MSVYFIHKKRKCTQSYELAANYMPSLIERIIGCYNMFYLNSKIKLLEKNIATIDCRYIQFVIQKLTGICAKT
jgi:hypothetical protein